MEFPFSETVVLKDELSGAVQEFTPIQSRQCFASMDVLRGRHPEVSILPVWDHLLQMLYLRIILWSFTPIEHPIVPNHTHASLACSIEDRG
jgi:hypothetical protein